MNRFRVFVFTALVLAVCNWSLLAACEDPDFDELAKIAERYACPQPKENDELIICLVSSTPFGPIEPQESGIYEPAFFVEAGDKNGILVLNGFSERICRSDRKIPATRKFFINHREASRQGYIIQSNALSTFETAVQLARLGKRDVALSLWREFSTSTYIDGGHPHEGIGKLVIRPTCCWLDVFSNITKTKPWIQNAIGRKLQTN